MFNISLQSLRVFESAARHGSFKQAANELALTPTAVSHHIKNLEQRLGLELFHRQVRNVQLTRAGEKLSNATTQSFTKIQSALAELANDSSAVRVQTTSSFAALVLIPRLSAFNEAYPDIKVDVSTGESVTKHSQQLTIRYGAAADIADAEILATESINVYGTPEFLARLKQGDNAVVYTTQWKNEQLPSLPWQAWLTQNQQDERRFNVRTFDQEMYGIQQAIAGQGLVFCSALLVDNWLAAAVLQPLDTQSVVSNLCYYIPNKSDLYGKEQVLMDWLTGMLSKG